MAMTTNERNTIRRLKTTIKMMLKLHSKYITNPAIDIRLFEDDLRDQFTKLKAIYERHGNLKSTIVFYESLSNAHRELLNNIMEVIDHDTK